MDLLSSIIKSEASQDVKDVQPLLSTSGNNKQIGNVIYLGHMLHNGSILNYHHSKLTIINYIAGKLGREKAW